MHQIAAPCLELHQDIETQSLRPVVHRLTLVDIRELRRPAVTRGFVRTIPAVFTEREERPLLPPDAMEAGHAADGRDEPFRIIPALLSVSPAMRAGIPTHGGFEIGIVGILDTPGPMTPAALFCARAGDG